MNGWKMHKSLAMAEGRNRVRSSKDPMDLIRYEVLEHLYTWVTQLLEQDAGNEAWTEYGWHLYQLRDRHRNWGFLDQGRWLVEAAYLHNRHQLQNLGRHIAKQIRRQLELLEQDPADF